MKISELKPEYVETMPERSAMKDGIIYICEQYGCAHHLCACGCGRETNMSIAPFWKDGWQMTKEDDGKVVSFTPSIGNFQMPCKSHYFIVKNQIKWC